MKTLTIGHDKLYKSVWIKKKKVLKIAVFESLNLKYFRGLHAHCPGGVGIDRDAPRKIKIKPPRETNVVMAQALTDP